MDTLLETAEAGTGAPRAASGRSLRVRLAARGPAVLAGLLLVVTLIPMSHTRTAVAYCCLGPLLCLLAGRLAAATRAGGIAAARLGRLGARIPAALVRPSAPVFCLLVGAASLVLGAAASVVLFSTLPGVSDSSLYLFQARIFLSGHLSAAVPPLPEFFASPFMLVDGNQWYSQYPPGFPALLALGVAFGTPWLVNPVLAAANAALVYRLGCEIASELEARVACLLAGLSPFVILMSADSMSHSASLLFATAFMLAVVIALKRGSAAAAALAGLSGALCFAVRPYSAVGICLVFAIVCVASLARARRWKALAAAALGAAGPLLLFGLYNLETTGGAFLLAYEKLHGHGHVPGFGATTWGVHTLGTGIVNTLTNLNALNKDLFQLPFPALALAAALFALGRPRFWDVHLLLSLASLVGFYLFYHYQDLYLGPRFLFDGVSALCLLSARGLACGLPWISRRVRAASQRRALVLSAAAALLCVFPAVLAARLWVVRHGYNDPAIVRAVAEQGLRNAVIFVPMDDSPKYVASYAENTPGLDGDVVYAADRGSDNARLLRLYPDRIARRWNGSRLVPTP